MNAPQCTNHLDVQTTHHSHPSWCVPSNPNLPVLTQDRQSSDQDGGTWENPEEKNKSKSSSENSGPFSHPVYKQISMRNGEINRMTKEQLKEKLAQLRLDTRGVKEVLKKRLKNFYKRQKLMKAQIKPSNGGEPHLDYLLVIDFEATCQENNPADFKYEIIEFPVILIDTRLRKVVDEFHLYVKPVLNPKLTNFCKDLTHITQNQVDESETFPEVHRKVLLWMEKHQLATKNKFAVVTDGPWDMARFMHKQCRISGIPFPRWARKWINIRKAFSNFYGFRRAKLTTMLESMGMTFEGHQHSGLDDSRNIARIVIRMIEDGYDLKVNERIYAHKLTVSDIVADLQVETVTPENDEHATGSSFEDGDGRGNHMIGEGGESCDDEKENQKDFDYELCNASTTGVSSSTSGGVTGGKFWCHSSAESTQSEESDASGQAAAALQNMHLDDGRQGGRQECFLPEQDDVSDLLEYYALQTS